VLLGFMEAAFYIFHPLFDRNIFIFLEKVSYPISTFLSDLDHPHTGRVLGGGFHRTLD
jgi:hypothetical protein